MRISSTTTYCTFHRDLKIKSLTIFTLLILFGYPTLHAQKAPFFAPADSLDKVRFYSALGIGLSSFTATSIGLYNSWYKNFDQSKFHLFNDWKEWRGMDKMGHAYTSYNLCNIGYQGARWTGISKKGGLVIAGIGSTVIQTTIEIMDGHSSKWGFSLGDVAFNTIGTGLFIAQQSFWDDQKFRIKVSSSRKDYQDQILLSQNGIESSISDRIDQLYGESTMERFLKDYNAQTIWVSANIKSIIPSAPVPKWLNLAFGFSGENLLGGFDNQWFIADEKYVAPENIYPRYHQFILSFDADLNKIKTKNHFVNSLLALLNSFKLPAPAIEYNSLKEWKFYLIYRS